MYKLREACLKYGFSGSKGRFYRCIGDGVLQAVFECHTAYIDPHSPEYSEKNRKAKCITIGLWSLYSELPEYIFDKETEVAHIHLSSMCSDDGAFMGNQTERKYMVEHGLDFLDTIKTQDQLVDTMVHYCRKERFDISPQQIDLFGAFLRCGRYREALHRVEALFTFYWMPYLYSNREHISLEQWTKVYTDKAYRIKDSQDLAKLWQICASAGINNELVEEYLLRNYNTNLQRLKAVGIPIIGSAEEKRIEKKPKRVLYLRRNPNFSAGQGDS